MLSFSKISLTYVVLGVLFCVLPFLDMINGYLVLNNAFAEGGLFSISQVSRSVIVVLLVTFAIKRQLSLAWVWVILIGGLLECLYFLLHQSFDAYLFGMVLVYRLLFLSVLIIVLSKIYQESPQLLFQFLKYNLAIISGSIVISALFDVGFSTYKWGSGTKGFFASGNGLGLYLGILTLVLMSLSYYTLHSHFRIGALYILLSCSAMLFVGTKTSFVLLLTVIVFYIFLSRYRALLILMLVFALVFGFGFIVEALSLSFDVVISRFRNSDSFLTFLVSGRNNYVCNAFDQFYSSSPSLFRYFFGAGSFVSFQDPASAIYFDTLETDIFDIFFMYGFFGLLIYIIFIVYGAYRLRSAWYLLVIWLLLVVHSILAGHIFFNAMSLTLVALIVALWTNSKLKY